MATPTTASTAPRGAKIHVRAGLELPTNRVRGMLPGPLNRMQFQVGKETSIAITAGIEHLLTRLMRDAYDVTSASGRERVLRRDVRHALDRAPHVYKPVLGDALALTGAGVTVHFEADAKPMLRATAGTRRRPLARSRRGAAVADAQEEVDSDDEDDESASSEKEEADLSEELSESSSDVSVSSSMSDDDAARPTQTTRRRATKKKLAVAAAQAVKAKKSKTKKAAAAATGKKRAAAGAPDGGRKSPAKRARK